MRRHLHTDFLLRIIHCRIVTGDLTDRKNRRLAIGPCLAGKTHLGHAELNRAVLIIGRTGELLLLFTFTDRKLEGELTLSQVATLEFLVGEDRQRSLGIIFIFECRQVALLEEISILVIRRDSRDGSVAVVDRIYLNGILSAIIRIARLIVLPLPDDVFERLAGILLGKPNLAECDIAIRLVVRAAQHPAILID